MSKSLLDSVTELFRPQLPTWACEFTSRLLVVAGVDSKRSQIIGKTAAVLSPGAFTGSLTERNFSDPAGALSLVRSGLVQAGLKGTEIGVVIPDDAARIALLYAENLPSGHEERETFIRWKLKKSMPFDLDSAQLAFKIIGARAGADGVGSSGTDLVVALSPRTVIEEYVELMEKANLNAGFVIPSTLAALNLFRPPAEDTLFVKIAPGCITTTVYQKQRLQFYRRVPEMPVCDAVYPTMMYYQDKLMGSELKGIVVCAAGGDAITVMAELQEKFEVPVHRLEPANIDDVFKPALGAVNLGGL